MSPAACLLYSAVIPKQQNCRNTIYNKTDCEGKQIHDWKDVGECKMERSCVKAVYVKTCNCENNVKSASNSILLLCPCSFWSVFTRSLIYVPGLQSSFLSLKPQFIILFLSSPLLCSVSRCSPRPHASHTLTQESKSSPNLFSPFSSFYHYIPLSSSPAEYVWWYCSQRKRHFWWKSHTIYITTTFGVNMRLWCFQREKSGQCKGHRVGFNYYYVYLSWLRQDNSQLCAAFDRLAHTAIKIMENKNK